MDVVNDIQTPYNTNTNKDFKQTDIGRIPNDWEVKTIGETLSIKHGKNQKEVISDIGEYPILGTGGLMGYASKFLYNKPSVLIGRKGTIDKPQYMNTPFWTVDTLFYSEVKEEYSPKYLFYKFHLISWYLYNEASGVPSLNAKTIESIQIPLPPTLVEQRAIATALSDADHLIQALEKLIAKKQDIKQGTMQDLLTGKRRLAGFEQQQGMQQTEIGEIPKDWDVKILNKICDVRDGTHDSPKYQDNGVMFITSKNIVKNKLDFEDVKYISLTDADEIDKRSKVDLGDILISMIGTIGNAVLIDFTPNFCIKNVALIKPFSKISEYLIHLFKSPFYQNYINANLDGGIQKFISLSVLRSLLVPLPPTLTEQTAIATILSDMDEEITALEKKLKKYRAIKQGMMQNLLTGKIRLI